MRRREFLVASAATLTLPAVARGEKGSVLKFIPFFDTPLDPVWDPSAGFHGIMVFDTRRARRLALSRGLGHADVWDAAGGRPAYCGHDDAAAREIDPRSGARPDLRRDPRHELRKSRQPGAGIF